MLSCAINYHKNWYKENEGLLTPKHIAIFSEMAVNQIMRYKYTNTASPVTEQTMSS